MNKQQNNFEEKTNFDELYMLNNLLDSRLSEFIGGGSYYENGRNLNFTFNGKPYIMRVEIDDFHYDYWKKHKIGYWSENFDKNSLKIQQEILSKTINQSRIIMDVLIPKPKLKFICKIKNCIKVEILYKILPIYYKHKLSKSKK
jgi:hypothetical protein